MDRKNILKYVIFAFLISGLHAQTISLSAFLEKVEQNHPFFEKEDLTTEILMKGRESLLGAEDWQISAEARAIRQRPASSSAFAPITVNAFGYQVGAERLFWNTGARLSVGWAYDFMDQDVPPIFLEGIGEIPTGSSSFFQNRIFAKYVHPLRQNKNGRLDKLPYELQAFSVNLSEIQARENKENFLLNTAVKYLDWVLVDQQVEIARQRQVLAEEQLVQTEKRRAAFLVDSIDVLRAEDAILIAKQNVLLLQAQWKADQAELAVIAKTPAVLNQSPDYDLYAFVDLPVIDTTIAELSKSSRLLQAISEQQKQLAYLRDGQEEALKAQLNLAINAGVLQGKDEFTGSLLPSREDLRVGLQYRVPLGKRTEKAKIEQTDLQIRQLDADYGGFALELEAALRGIVVKKSEIEKVLLLNQEQIASAIKKTTEEVKHYNQGRGQLTFVIQSRDNEQNARLIYLQNAKIYHDLILQYQALTDNLFKDN